MVRIDRVHTGVGDAGTTRLTDGSEVSKDHPLIVALGDIDELNCVLGVVASSGPPEQLAGVIQQVQNDLFDLGADLATPIGGPHEAQIPRITDRRVVRLESWLDELSAALPALTSFVLPGGSSLAAQLHLARAVARRAERSLVAAWEDLNRGSLAHQSTLRYLNRLSDLWFQWARRINAGADVLWEPNCDR